MFFRKTFPSVAVIIPVYNVTEFLEEAVSSAVNQNYRNIEVIVVDDGSIHEEAENIKNICSKFEKVRLIRQENHGAAHARDTGVANTEAEYIVFLDGDDILRPKAVSYLIKALVKNPEAVAVYARMKDVSENGGKIKKTKLFIQKYPSGKKVLETLLKGRLLFSNGSICIRRKILENIPKNNYDLKIGEDWVLWCNLALAGDIVFAGRRIVFYRRLHSNNTSYIFFNDISYISKAMNVIHEDARFINKVGKARLVEIKKEYLSLMNLLFAANKIRSLERSKATRYFSQVSIPMSKLDMIKIN